MGGVGSFEAVMGVCVEGEAFDFEPNKLDSADKKAFSNEKLQVEVAVVAGADGAVVEAVEGVIGMEGGKPAPRDRASLLCCASYAFCNPSSSAFQYTELTVGSLNCFS